MWNMDPVMTPFQNVPGAGRLPGYAGPPDQKAAEVLTKYIIIDMYAKAVQGMAAEDAVKWARRTDQGIHVNARPGAVGDPHMTFTTVAAPRTYAGTPRRGPVTRLLEDERWLAMLLLLPTVVLLGLFIAYPFVKGVMLSVTDARVGVPGHFVGLQNFVKVWNDSIFRVAVWNTFVYTLVATVFKLALGLWLALLLNRNFKGQGALPAPSSCCRSSFRRCCRPSPGSGCSTRPSASSTGGCSSSA